MTSASTSTSSFSPHVQLLSLVAFIIFTNNQYQYVDAFSSVHMRMRTNVPIRIYPRSRQEGQYNYVHSNHNYLSSTKLRMTNGDGDGDGDAGTSTTNKDESSKPTIAIIGSGAVGCYYGARLWETNQYTLKFFMRGEHYTTSIAQGLNVTSVQGDIFIPPDDPNAYIYDNPQSIGVVDWVIVAIKSTGIDALPELLGPLLADHTRVIAIMNGLVDDDIVRLLEGGTGGVELEQDQNQGLDLDLDLDLDQEPVLSKCAAVYGGMALLCSNRKAPGHIDHSYAGKLTVSLARSSSSSASLPSSEEYHKKAMLELWEPTQGFEFCYDDNCVRARWSKALWNLPFNGISVAMNGITVDKIVQDAGLRRLAYQVMDETIEAANRDLEARGFSEEQFLGDVERSAMMALSDAMGPYKTSTMLDLTNGRPMEVKYVFRKFVDRAHRLGVSVPTLETLVTQIEFLQRTNNLF